MSSQSHPECAEIIMIALAEIMMKDLLYTRNTSKGIETISHKHGLTVCIPYIYL